MVVAVNGFAGITEQGGKIVCKPSLPEKWKGMSFELMYKNKLYAVDIRNESVVITECGFNKINLMNHDIL